MEMNSGKTSCKNVSNLTSKRYQLTFMHVKKHSKWKKRLHVYPSLKIFSVMLTINDCLLYGGGAECRLV